ncbi:MAG: hypothetical protein ACKO14_01070, partial [Armatimonadota bacterium]
MADRVESQPSIPPDPGEGQQGRRSKGRGNRNNNRGQPKEEKKGQISELGENVYRLYYEGSEATYGRTTTAIAEYVASRVKHAGEFRMALENLSFRTLTKPVATKEAKENDPVAMMELKQEYSTYCAAVENRRICQETVFPIILGQCTRALRTKLEADSTYAGINTASDVMGLMKLIRSKAFTGGMTGDAVYNARQAEKAFTEFHQTSNMSISTYHQTFLHLLHNCERFVGTVGVESLRVERWLEEKMNISSADDATAEQMATARAASREAYLAMVFLERVDYDRHGGLILDLKKKMALDGQPYPQTLAAAYNGLLAYQAAVAEHRNATSHGHGVTGGNPMFLQEESEGGGGNGRNGGNRGGGRGGRGNRGRGGGNSSGGRGSGNNRSNNDSRDSDENTASDNTDSTRVHDYPFSPTSSSTSNHAVSLQQNHGEARALPLTWVVLDSASSIDMFINGELLRNIKQAPTPIRITTNAGEVSIRLQGELPGYPEPVWYHPEGAANILSLRNMSKHYRIVFDSSASRYMRVYLTPDQFLDFYPSDRGLYYYDTVTSATSTSTTNMRQSAESTTFSFITTVDDKKAAYTQRGLKDAQLARKIQNIMMRPNTRKFMDLVSKNLIRNCPITRRHIQAAEDIYGPNLGSLRGKTPRANVGHVLAAVDPVPPEVLTAHGTVTLAIDVKFINKVPFLITVSRDLRIGSITALENRRTTYVQQCLRHVLARYERRGFTIGTILADDEFAALVPRMPTYAFNICGADEHVPEIERYIRTTTKNTIRSQYNDMPYTHLPRGML